MTALATAGRAELAAVLGDRQVRMIVLLALVIWLGFWQLERSEQKRELLARQQARQEAAP